MVMKIDSEAIISLKVALLFDDGTTKTQIFSEGDYVRVAYNQNGTRRVVSGTVNSIHADPYRASSTKRDWYFNVINDDPDASIHVVKVMVINMLDIEVIHKKHQEAYVGTPNDPTRVTSIRVVNGYLQISQNEGHTWRTIDQPLSDKPVPPDDDIMMKLEAMIGSDQYATSDEFLQAVVDLIHKESRKRRHKPWVEEPVSNRDDMAGHYSNPIPHSGGLAVGPEVSDFRF